MSSFPTVCKEYVTALNGVEDELVTLNDRLNSHTTDYNEALQKELVQLAAAPKDALEAQRVARRIQDSICSFRLDSSIFDNLTLNASPLLRQVVAELLHCYARVIASDTSADAFVPCGDGRDAMDMVRLLQDKGFSVTPVVAGGQTGLRVVVGTASPLPPETQEWLIIE